MKAFHEVRNYTSDFMVWHECYQNISFVAHWHREIELIYVREGTAEIHVTDTTLNVKKGDLVLCDSGDIHYCDTHSEDCKLDFLLFDTGIISNHYQYNSFSCPMFSKEQLEEKRLAAEWTRLLHILDEELRVRSIYYQDIVKADLRAFWYRLLRDFPDRANLSIMHNRRKNMLSDFQNVLTFLEEHYNENITLEDAAEMMGFSPSHFSRLFKQLTGTGFVRYLNIIRISQAAENLLSTDLKITDIAFQTGFTNVRTFNRVFLEITGITPSEYSKKPERKDYNFTYYRSSADIVTLPENNPTIKNVPRF